MSQVTIEKATTENAEATPTTVLLEQAYREHGGRLLNHIMYRCRDIEESRDLLHETFIRAANNLAAKPQTEIRYGWLATIANNLITDYFRRLAVRNRHFVPALIENQEEGTTWTPGFIDESTDHNPEAKTLVRERLAELHITQEDSLLCYLLYAGYSQEAAGRLLKKLGYSVTASTVKDRLYRIRHQQQPRRRSRQAKTRQEESENLHHA